MSSSGSQIGAVGLPLFAAVAEAENLAPVVAAGADAAFGPLLDEAMSGDPGGTEASEPRLTDEKSRQEEQAQPAFLYNVIPVTGFVVFAGAGESQATNCSTPDIADGARNTNAVPVGTDSGNPEEPLPAVPAAGKDSEAQPGPLREGDLRNVVPVQRRSKPNVQEMGPAIGDQATSGTQGRTPVFEGQGAQTAPATTNDGILPLKHEGARVLDEPVVPVPDAVPAATTRQDAQTPPRRAEGPRVLDEPVAPLSPEVRPALPGDGAQTVPRGAEGAAQLPDAAPAAATREDVQTAPSRSEGARVSNEPVAPVREAVPAAATREGAQTAPRRAEGAAQLPDALPAAATREGAQSAPSQSESARVWNEPVAPVPDAVPAAATREGVQTAPSRSEGARVSNEPVEPVREAVPAPATREGAQTVPRRSEGARVLNEPIAPVREAVPAAATREGAQTVPRQSEGVRVVDEPVAPLSPEVPAAMPGDGAQTVPRRAEGAAQLPDAVPAAATREGARTAPRQTEGARVWKKPVAPLSPEVHAAMAGDGAQTVPRRAEGAAQLPDAVPAAATREDAQTAPRQSEGVRVVDEPVAPLSPEVPAAMPGEGAQTVPRRAEGAAQLPEAAPAAATREGAQTAPRQTEGARVWNEPVAPLSPEVHAAMAGDGAQTVPRRAEGAAQLPDAVPAAATREGAQTAPRRSEGARVSSEPVAPLSPEVPAAMPGEGAQTVPRRAEGAAQLPDAAPAAAMREGAQTAPRQTEGARVWNEPVAPLSLEVPAAMPSEGVKTAPLRPERARFLSKPVAQLPIGASRSAPRNAIRWTSAVEGQRAQTVRFRPEGPRGELSDAMPAEGAQPLARTTSDPFSPFPSDITHAMNQPAADDGSDSAPVFKEQVAQTAPARTNNSPIRPEDPRVFGEQAAALPGEVSAATPASYRASAAEDGIVRSSIRPESARDSGERVVPGATVVASPDNANETDGIARLHPPVIRLSREHAPPSGQRGPDFSDEPAATSAGDSAASATTTDGATELTASAEAHDKNVLAPHPEWQRFVASRYERAEIGLSFRRTEFVEGPAVMLDVRERNAGTPVSAAVEAGLHEGSEVKRNSFIGHGESAAGSPVDGERQDPVPGAILAAPPKPYTHSTDRAQDARPAPAGTQIPEPPETQAERAPKAGPVRALNLRLEAVDKPAVRVSLREHAGEIRVVLHSPEAEVRQSLREGVGGLIDTLEKGGYTAALARPENHPDTRRDGQPDQQQSRGESSPQQQHGDKQHRERNARRWLEQWDQASWR